MAEEAGAALPRRRLRIGESLVQAGVIVADDLRRALAEQRKSGGRLGQVLIRLGALSEDSLMRALGAQLSLPLGDLDRTRVPAKLLKPFPPSFMSQHGVFPVAVVEEHGEIQVWLACSDPTNFGLLDRVSLAFGGLPVKPMVVPESAIDRAIERHFPGALQTTSAGTAAPTAPAPPRPPPPVVSAQLPPEPPAPAPPEPAIAEVAPEVAPQPPTSNMSHFEAAFFGKEEVLAPVVAELSVNLDALFQAPAERFPTPAFHAAAASDSLGFDDFFGAAAPPAEAAPAEPPPALVVGLAVELAEEQALPPAEDDAVIRPAAPVEPVAAISGSARARPAEPVPVAPAPPRPLAAAAIALTIIDDDDEDTAPVPTVHPDDMMKRMRSLVRGATRTR